MTPDPATIERMAIAHWNETEEPPWDDIPEAWRTVARIRMAAAIQAQRQYEEREAMR